MKGKEIITTTASQLMVDPPAIVRLDNTIMEVVWLLYQNQVPTIPVLNHRDQLQGIVTWHQIVSRMVHSQSLDQPVREILQTDQFLVFQLEERVDLDFVFDNYDIICVCEGDKFKGVIYITSILKFCKWKTATFSRFEDLSKEYAAILNSCRDLICVCDPAGGILWSNEPAGGDGVDPDAKDADALAAKQLFLPAIARMVYREKKPRTILRQSGGGNRVLVTGTPIFGGDGEGDVVRVVTVSRDIDALARDLEQRADSKELDELSRQLELANPKTEKLLSELQQLRQDHLSGQKIANHVSREMRDITQQVKKVACVDTQVLLLGESGVGKDVFAGIIHRHSQRKNAPFLKINCGAIPENLLESELFGYEAGAFTGAGNKRKLGLLEVANDGTVFLDEIAELPLHLQVKLLHVLQEHAFLRVGGTRPIHVQVRVIAATNKDLAAMVQKGTFREDLYYRLNVVPITIPPLRKRREDIPLLLLHYMDHFNNKHHRNRQLSAEVINILLHYDWPGNIRELRNLMERLVVIGDDNIVHPYELPQNIMHSQAELHYRYATVAKQQTLADAVHLFEVKMIKDAYKKYKTTNKVAEVLGVNRSTLSRKLQKDL